MTLLTFYDRNIAQKCLWFSSFFSQPLPVTNLYFCSWSQLLFDYHIINFVFLKYLHSRVVAALLHMQQGAALAPCPELDLQAAGTGGVRGHALQRLSQKDITFRALLHRVVQTTSTIQGQGGVCCHVCQGKRISSVLSALHWHFTDDCKTFISTSELAGTNYFPHSTAMTTNRLLHSHQWLRIPSCVWKM